MNVLNEEARSAQKPSSLLLTHWVIYIEQQGSDNLYLSSRCVQYLQISHWGLNFYMGWAYSPQQLINNNAALELFDSFPKSSFIIYNIFIQED